MKVLNSIDTSDTQEMSFKDIPTGCLFEFSGKEYEKRSSRTAINHSGYQGAEWFKGKDTVIASPSLNAYFVKETKRLQSLRGQ